MLVFVQELINVRQSALVGCCDHVYRAMEVLETKFLGGFDVFFMSLVDPLPSYPQLLISASNPGTAAEVHLGRGCGSS